MSSTSQRTVRLRLENELELLPTLQGFVENSARTFGLDETGSLSLTLAGEEVFSYLCRAVEEGCEITVDCRAGSFYTDLEFVLPLPRAALKSFNLTATVNPDDEESLEEMGLLIASRMVDRLRLEHSASGRLRLCLTREKSYPEYQPESSTVQAPPPGTASLIATPDIEELKFLLRTLLETRTDEEKLPPDFAYPGKLADMLAGGDLDARIVKDEAGRIGGGIVWQWLSTKVVECRGPFLTATTGLEEEQRRQLADNLFEECVRSIAKSPAVGILNRFPGRDLSRSHFEILGEDDGPVLFRQMHEDPGAVAWHPPELEDFLRRKYRDLLLPRELRLLHRDAPENNEFSVVACEFERGRDRVTVTPLLAGRDLHDNLVAHLELFRQEGLREILFRLDLGSGDEAGFAEALLELDFVPGLILPHGGERGDLLYLRYRGKPA
ncbi:MAG: hypothetical protein GXO34_04475 [Deltaproteobacteria bacterium]|nr:hypothetical protein [Deltaproteobacteria bacterium]